MVKVENIFCIVHLSLECLDGRGNGRTRNHGWRGLHKSAVWKEEEKTIKHLENTIEVTHIREKMCWTNELIVQCTSLSQQGKDVWINHSQKSFMRDDDDDCIDCAIRWFGNFLHDCSNFLFLPMIDYVFAPRLHTSTQSRDVLTATCLRQCA